MTLRGGVQPAGALYYLVSIAMQSLSEKTEGEFK
jgi:hypothetical protein